MSALETPQCSSVPVGRIPLHWFSPAGLQRPTETYPMLVGLNGAGHARVFQRQRATLTGVEGKKTVRTRAHGPPTPSSLHSVDLPFPSYLRLSRSRCAIEPGRWNVCKHGSIHGVFLCFVHGHGLLLLILSFPTPSARRADKARGCAGLCTPITPIVTSHGHEVYQDSQTEREPIDHWRARHGLRVCLTMAVHG